MKSGTKVFIHSPELDNYPYPPHCPFDSSRAGKTRNTLNSMGHLSGPDRKEIPANPPSIAQLHEFHSPTYLTALQRAGDRHLDHQALQLGLGREDTPIFDGMFDYAALACGATLTGAQLILSNEAQIVFNPSGGYHHAHPESASGFCYINDPVIACLFLTKAARKVLFLDIDAHHADGVQDAFYRRNDVMTISLHESGKTLFPGTGFATEIGTKAGLGFCANIPLPVGIQDQAYLRVFREVVPPLIDVYAPDIILLEIGADALAGDPLTHLALTNNVYAEIIQTLLAYRKPILATGGGGYNVQNTVRAWALAWTALCGDSSPADLVAGLGGVMLESTDWQGGFRDRVQVPDTSRQQAIDTELDAVIRELHSTLFPIHGL